MSNIIPLEIIKKINSLIVTIDPSNKFNTIGYRDQNNVRNLDLCWENKEYLCWICGKPLPLTKKGKQNKKIHYCSSDCSQKALNGWWTNIRDNFLKEHRFCAWCEKKAKEVHHILPVYCGGTSIKSNLIALCVECHNLTKSNFFMYHYICPKCPRSKPNEYDIICYKFKNFKKLFNKKIKKTRKNQSLDLFIMA